MLCKYQYSKKLHSSTVKEAASCNLLKSLTDIFVFVSISNSFKYCYSIVVTPRPCFGHKGKREWRGSNFFNTHQQI